VAALSAVAHGPSGAAKAPLPRRLEPDLNASPARHLVLLPGIGPVRARAIVEERARGGPFGGVSDVVRVRGIGPAIAGHLEGRARAGAVPVPRGPRGLPAPAAAEEP